MFIFFTFWSPSPRAELAHGLLRPECCCVVCVGVSVCVCVCAGVCVVDSTMLGRLCVFILANFVGFDWRLWVIYEEPQVIFIYISRINTYIMCVCVFVCGVFLWVLHVLCLSLCGVCVCVWCVS